MGGEDEHFGDLYVFGGLSGIEGGVGDVVAGEGCDAFVDVVGTLVVAVEAYVAEVGLDQSGFEKGHAYLGVGDVDAQTV